MRLPAEDGPLREPPAQRCWGAEVGDTERGRGGASGVPLLAGVPRTARPRRPPHTGAVPVPWGRGRPGILKVPGSARAAWHTLRIPPQSRGARPSPAISHGGRHRQRMNNHTK